MAGAAADDGQMDHDDAPRLWPTTAGGLGGESDWTPIEVVVADLLADLTHAGPPTEDEGLLVFYLPFTDLGRDGGDALCWEANLSSGASSSGEVSEVGVGEHPLLALSTLPSVADPARAGAATATSPAPGARRALVAELQQRWAGWSVLLRQAAVIASQGPATAQEPSVDGFDLDVRWSNQGAGPGWVWLAGGMEVLDQDGESVGVRQWGGDSPAAALRAALADAATWFDPTP